MQKSIEKMHADFSKVRTGRAHPSLLDGVSVNHYGQDTVLSQMSTITVEGRRTLLVAPWDKEALPLVEKAIIAANLGLNPSTQDGVIRIILPALSEEQRQTYVRQVRQVAEQVRIAVRNIRRDANHALKNMTKNVEIGKDEQQSGEERIQQITKQQIGQIDETLKVKEADLMEL